MTSDRAQRCEIALKGETITDEKTNPRMPDSIIQKWVFKDNWHVTLQRGCGAPDSLISFWTEFLHFCLASD